MDKNENCDCNCHEGDKKWWRHARHWHKGGGGGAPMYGLGIIGALFYFLQNVTGFVPVVIAVFKSLFWPAFLVFKLLEFFRV